MVASAGMLALLTGFMLYFHIARYAYLASALAGSLVIYLWSRPTLSGLAITALLGSALEFSYSLIKKEPVWGASLAFFGLASLAHLGLSTLWRSKAQRQTTLETCLTASMFPLFLVLSGFSLAVTTIVHPKTYDLFLYAFDEQLGGSPSFLVGRLFANFGAIRQICFIGYEALPLAMALAFVLDRKRLGGRASNIVQAFAVAAAGGFLLYNFYPAAGPVHVFGPQFPFRPPAVGPSPFRLVAVESAPRNAMPSVHVAMALLILWNSRRWAAGWRVLAATLLGVTVMATLGFGEHYLVDLFVAVPFALMAQGIAASGVSWRSLPRISAVGAGAALVMAWLMYLRLPDPPLNASGIWAWALLLGTLIAAIRLERNLQRADVGYHPPLCLPERGYPRLASGT